MAPSRPRFSVGVMAMCCGFLSLTVVAREANPGLSSSLSPVQQQMHPGASALVGGDSPTRATTPLPLGTSSASGDSKRHRKTRETFPLSRPTNHGEDVETRPETTEHATRHRRMEPKMDSLPSRLVFMPSRGRRYGGFSIPTEKRQLTIEQMLEKGDYFVPNRGKKSPTAGSSGGNELMIKKGKFDVLLGSGAPDEYFFPNRGKKEYFVAYEPLAASVSGGKFASAGFAGEVRHPSESRLRRNLLENLANEHKDTFFSSRGKRFLPAPDGLMLWPGEALPVEGREVLPDDGTAAGEDFSDQPGDMLWNDAMPLFPLDRTSSS
ncbi:AGAP005277-PA-like protein [Anopheles sinensis]|uniref:AGAP005277-PA-like protein n=1 Tax=Anopheles sinensis TaxID=74873 RepID=A0A084VXJ7_ANOSI|nr:AGAP005277-PA-like protein [Anopheles sinensis]